MATRQVRRVRPRSNAAARSGEAPARAARGSRSGRPGARRYAVVYDVDGPVVRLGVVWFVLAILTLAVGPLAAALLFGTVAAIAAAQTASAWRRHDADTQPNVAVSAGLAGGMALGACLGAGGAGLVLLASVAVAVAVATGDRASARPVVADAGWTIQCSLPPGMAAMSMVLLARLDQGSAIAVLLLVSAYETGDYLVGSGAGNPFEGPLAGLCALLVLTFIVASLPISTLSFVQAWVFGALVAVLAPAGQLVASALLPAASARASGLRRLDSWLLVAPVWCLGVGLVL